MLLHKLYSEPLGLFSKDVIEFKNGINFVFAKKDKDSDSKNSLNGVGKSLFLNFLDFALFSSKTEHIKSAKENNKIDDYIIVLEFSIKDKDYIIKRALKEENKNIIFGLKEKPFVYESINEAKQTLCDLIFKEENYKGKYYSTWLRKLLPFFIKKQENPKTKVNFLDPIQFSNFNEMESVPYHLFLLGIDNSLFWKNFEIKSDLKIKDKAIKEIKSLIVDTYGLKDIPQAENTIDRLKAEVIQHEKNIKKFQLADQYKNIEEESNKLTAEIKDLWYQNHLDNKKIESYKDSYRLGDTIKTTRIKNLYFDLNEILAINIKKTLDEAIKFRKSISESRKEFLSQEIKNIEVEILERSNKIKNIEIERSKLFEFLEAKEAIRDLSEAYLNLSKKREQLNELEGKIKLYQDLNGEITEREAEIANLYVEITKFIKKIHQEISDFRNIFFEVHNSIYPENKDKSFGFNFAPNNKKDSKVDMKVFLPAELAKGKNKGRTLIYDLSLLFSIIERNNNFPRFLVHDGIFDGMDPAHFVSLYEYLERLSINKNFQYIITLNEEGELDGRFGDIDKINPKKIEDESILTLTPSKKLLNADWE